MFKFKDYAPATVKKYVKIAYDFYLKNGIEKVKVNKIIFDFSKKEKTNYYAYSQGSYYFFEVIEN